VHSNACLALELPVAEFIKENWYAPALKGLTGTCPISFQMHGGKTLDDFSSPPYSAKVGDPVRELTLNATFGPDGYIASCYVSHSSGDRDLDQEVKVWAQVHWHHSSAAGTTINIPVELRPPASKAI
jgi:hypothetical protein